MLRSIFAARTLGGRGRRAEMGDFGDGAGRGSVVGVVRGESCSAEDGRRAVESAGAQRGCDRLGGGVRFAGRRSRGMRRVGL